METLPADTTGIALALAVLRAGGAVVHATETCYGLACDLSNPDAVSCLFRIKQRPPDQPVSALFESIEQAKQYVEWNEEADELSRKFLPGPLTIVLRLKKLIPTPTFLTPSVPDLKTKTQKRITIGVRVSGHPLATRLVRDFGKPLSTTSANLHGRPNPYTVNDILGQFKHRKYQPDVILDFGTLPQSPPSTVIDLTQSEPTIYRQGLIKFDGKQFPPGLSQ